MRWTQPITASSIAPCPVHASVASATAEQSATMLSQMPRPPATSAASAARATMTMRSFHAAPIAEPVSSAPTASRSIGQAGVPAIEEAISTTQAPENNRLRPALAMNQGRSASASPRSRARSP